MQQGLKKQNGFSILAVILVIVAVIVAIGVWALSGQTNTGNSGNSTSDIQASSIINDASSIKLAFDNLVVNGSTATGIVFQPNVASTATAPNMLDPTNGIQAPKPNASAIRTNPSPSDGMWVYNATAFIGNAVGTSAADQVILLGGIKDTVCQRINNILNGSTTINPSTYFSATAGATVVNPNTSTAVSLNGAPFMVGATSGCLLTNGGADNNFYFRILKAN